MFDTSLAHQRATLASCESEQLHLSGRIQSYGVLLVVRLADRRITHASANAEHVFGISLTGLLGTALHSHAFYIPDFEAAFALPANEKLFLANIAVPRGAYFDVTLLRQEDSVLVEWELRGLAQRPIAIQQMHRTLVRPPAHKEHIARYHQTLLSHIRQITDMDRVMIYQFRDDWCGEVVAECCNGELGSYRDMRFPATDIPEIARKLYLQNPYRMIPDVDGTVYPLWSEDPQPPDLSGSDLRSVSPMHLEYMRNMGVKASFSMPIVIKGQLWGLVACHHYNGLRLLSQDQRQACTTLAGVYSQGLAVYLSNTRLQELDSMERQARMAAEPFLGVSNPLDSLVTFGGALANLVNAEGVAMAFGEQAVISGMGPDLNGLAVIDDWFLNYQNKELVAHERLDDIFLHFPEVGLSSCGLLAVKVRVTSRGGLRFYWFRQAETQYITWAGNPNKPSAENAAATHLSPRRSFEKWVETRTGYSREWTSREKLMALKFRKALGRVL